VARLSGLDLRCLPEHLIDDMLFGHEKGAFTGAQKDFKGLFEQAQGGTLFLDEIGETPMHLQSKLLRVLQERLLTRLGSERQVAIDVRIIAATNKDLRVAIAEREFREDLYFRISTFKLRVPPLRERKGDILPLVASLLLRHAPNAQAFTLSDMKRKRNCWHTHGLAMCANWKTWCNALWCCALTSTLKRNT
jgi:two-component system response regulator FlrC